MAAAVPDKRKKKRNRTAREQALIVAAGKLFASRGYEVTTTREIAALARCAEGLIHRYFESKAGLLLALIKFHGSHEVIDLDEKLPLASSLAGEIEQLVNWEIDRMWEARGFLRVIVPRVLVDPALGHVLTRSGPLHHAQAIGERLRKFSQCRSLPDEDIEALANFVKTTGFMFGFARPVVLRQDRERAKKMAIAIAKIMTRSFQLPATSSDYLSRGTGPAVMVS